MSRTKNQGIAPRNLFSRTASLDRALLGLARNEPEIRENLRQIGKAAAKWKTLPKGWTQKSVEKFWTTLTGEAKHKVTKCIKEMGDKIDDPGAFCASLADRVDPGWRSRKAAVSPEIVCLARQVAVRHMRKKAGWVIQNLKSGNKVTDRQVYMLANREYTGVHKGSLKWDAKTHFNKYDNSVTQGFSLEGFDPHPEYGGEFTITGQIAAGISSQGIPFCRLELHV
jgi:hypothetical protein